MKYPAAAESIMTTAPAMPIFEKDDIFMFFEKLKIKQSSLGLK
jgi:hypothetical protein